MCGASVGKRVAPPVGARANERFALHAGQRQDIARAPGGADLAADPGFRVAWSRRNAATSGVTRRALVDRSRYTAVTANRAERRWRAQHLRSSVRPAQPAEASGYAESAALLIDR